MTTPMPFYFVVGMTIDTLENQQSYQLAFGRMDADDSKTIE